MTKKTPIRRWADAVEDNKSEMQKAARALGREVTTQNICAIGQALGTWSELFHSPLWKMAFNTSEEIREWEVLKKSMMDIMQQKGSE